MTKRSSFWFGWLLLCLLVPLFAADQAGAQKPAPEDPKSDKTDPAKKPSDADPKKPAAEKDAKDAPKKDDKDAKKAATDKDSKESKKATEEKEPPKEKLTPLGKITGKLQRVEGSQKYITVQIQQSQIVPQVNNGGYRGRPSVSYRVQQTNKSIDVVAADDLKVRSMRPPPDFDDKGKPRRYSQKELQDLKGSDPKLPGYAADFDSLKPDQVVLVHLATRKSPAELKAAAKGASPATKQKELARGKGKDSDEEGEAMDEEKPLATMIVILAEAVK